MSGHQYAVYYLKDNKKLNDLSKNNLITVGLLPFDKKLKEGDGYEEKTETTIIHFTALKVNNKITPKKVIFRLTAECPLEKYKIISFLAWHNLGRTAVDSPQTLELTRLHDAVLVEVNWGDGDEKTDDYWVRIFTTKKIAFNDLFEALAELQPMKIDNPEYTSDELLGFNMKADFLQVYDILAIAGHNFVDGREATAG